MYTRQKPLLPIEGRFENYYLRYKVGEENSYLEVEVWNVAEWRDNLPIFYHAYSLGPEQTDPAAVKPLFQITVKYDGCSHWWMPYFHFDSLEELDTLVRCVKYIWDDLCSENDVGD